MENPNLLLSDTDFVEAWENFLHYHSRTNQLLALTKSSTSRNKALLYAEAVQAHIKAIETSMRMNQLVQRWVETMVKKRRDMTPEQIIIWNQELKVRNLETVARSIYVRFISRELRGRDF